MKKSNCQAVARCDEDGSWCVIWNVWMIWMSDLGERVCSRGQCYSFVDPKIYLSYTCKLLQDYLPHLNPPTTTDSSSLDTCKCRPRLLKDAQGIFPDFVQRALSNFSKIEFLASICQLSSNKMVLEPNVSPHKHIIKDDDVKECISIE